jgi:hypothetical protein
VQVGVGGTSEREKREVESRDTGHIFETENAKSQRGAERHIYQRQRDTERQRDREREI